MLERKVDLLNVGNGEAVVPFASNRLDGSRDRALLFTRRLQELTNTLKLRIRIFFIKDFALSNNIARKSSSVPPFQTLCGMG